LESGDEASNVEAYFDEEEEEEEWRITNRRPPQGRNKNIHPFVGPAKGVKNSEAPHIDNKSLPLSVLMFFTEIFYVLVEQTNVYYQQHLYSQAKPSC
jgi:hypothetical protein